MKRVVEWARWARPVAVGLWLVGCASGSDGGACEVPCPSTTTGACQSTPTLGTGSACDVGDPLPGTVLSDCCGRLVSLADVVCRARATVVELGAGWCVECRNMAPDLNRWVAEHDDLAVISVLRDTTAAGVPATRSFCGEWSRDLCTAYPVVIDPGDAITTACAAAGLPTTLVVDSAGRIVAKITGEAPRAIEQAFTELLAVP